MEIKPNKQGFYKCPYCPPSTNGYPARKWKTEKGILKHLSECNYTPEKMLLKKEKEESDKIKFDILVREALQLLNIGNGDRIYYVKSIVVKPEYEWRGNRRVRVRYEEVLKFEACSVMVHSIDAKYSDYFTTANAVLTNCLFINGTIMFDQICADRSSAELKAKKLQDNHDAYLKFSSECR